MQKLNSVRHVIIRAALTVIASVLFAGSVALAGSNEFSDTADLRFQQQTEASSATGRSGGNLGGNN